MRYVKILLVLFVIVSGCQKLKPAGFWVSYQEPFLKENISEFGPYGGFSAMHWRASESCNFSKKDILKFAKDHGWQFADTVLVSSDAVTKYHVSGKPYFPFSYTNFSKPDNLEPTFPRWIDSDLIVFRHRTGFLAIQPGNAIQTEINGYIVISADSSQFSVYHLWGE
ncbi:MAG: hypothetical protein ABIN80_24875 [Dyadobacter sp.]|uniref:hypothetical protein n=1 Tax=Dyadobacter sp. TaxID=1914288 RepID=UPI003264E604